tara:strand:+ start:9796 stop:10710 length:915 start_codon:yes stop_codon:yes gene_type:complete
MKLLITGGSGTLGQNIAKLALSKNYQVNVLTRNKKLPSDENGVKYYYWDPRLKKIDYKCFDGVDSVINLSGYNVFCFWTNKNKSKILDSRVESTSFILSQIKDRNIKIKSFVSASGIAAYSNLPSVVSTEEHGVDIPSSFINQVVIKWESKVRDYEKILPEISFSILRLGLVLSNCGGLFKISKNLSKLFLLSPLGTGKQWQSWIHIDDVSTIFLRSIENNEKGIINLVSPNPVIQKDLLRIIALNNNSKVIFPNIPTFIVKTFFGEMSELVLSSQKVRSERLNDYVFKFSKIDLAVKDLSDKI